MSKLKILGVPGSLRKASYNLSALKSAQKLVPADAEIEIFDLHGIPSFNEDEERTPPERVVEFKKKIREADAILFATPEYNYSIPGVLKNAIDWASRPYGDSAWNGKPAAILGASAGAYGTVRAQYHLRQSFVFLNIQPVQQPEVLIGPASQKFDAEGNLTDEKTKKLISQLLENLIGLTKQMRK